MKSSKKKFNNKLKQPLHENKIKKEHDNIKKGHKKITMSSISHAVNKGYKGVLGFEKSQMNLLTGGVNDILGSPWVIILVVGGVAVYFFTRR